MSLSCPFIVRRTPKSKPKPINKNMKTWIIVPCPFTRSYYTFYTVIKSTTSEQSEISADQH